MKTDFESGNFVGVAEDSVHSIIQNIFGLKQRWLRELPAIGIYRQVPIGYLVKWQVFTALREDFQKGSVDIFIINKEHSGIAIRVQGKKGNLKMQRESLQKTLLEDALIKVVDIHKRECKELFKERVNEKSIKEVKDSFKTAGVEFIN